MTDVIHNIRRRLQSVNNCLTQARVALNNGDFGIGERFVSEGIDYIGVLDDHVIVEKATRGLSSEVCEKVRIGCRDARMQCEQGRLRIIEKRLKTALSFIETAQHIICDTGDDL